MLSIREEELWEETTNILFFLKYTLYPRAEKNSNNLFLNPKQQITDMKGLFLRKRQDQKLLILMLKKNASRKKEYSVISFYP